MNLPLGLYPTYKVFEAIDETEFDALTKKNQDKVLLMVSTSQVLLLPGTKSRLKLKELFPEGTTTFAALTELIGEPF